MKKIYSFMLLAAAMLLSANVTAATHEVNGSDYAALKAAFQLASGGDTVKLTQNVSWNWPTSGLGALRLYFEDADPITLDLNGKDISVTANTSSSADHQFMFELYRGNLIVKNGNLRNTLSSTTSKKRPQIFKVMGTIGNVAPGSYTHLTIEKDVNIYVTNGKGCAIAVDIVDAGVKLTNDNSNLTTDKAIAHTKVNNYSVTRGFASGVMVEVKDSIFVGSEEGYCVKANGLLIHPADHLTRTAGPDATQIESDWINAVPKIILHKGAYLQAHATHEGAAAIYSGGYAVWDIQCEATGACALAAKSGELTVSNATLTTTAPFNAASTKTSGIDATGSAVLIESNSSYSGHVDITFTGDSKVEATNGYAILEAIPTPASGSKVSNISIQGGQFYGNAEEGCITISNGTLTNPTSTVTIGGGSYASATNEQQEKTQTLLETLLGNITPSNPDYTVEVNNGTTQGTGTSIIISTNPIPDPAPQGATFNIDNLMDLANNDANLKEANPVANLVLPTDLTLKDLFMICDNPVTIVVPDGKIMNTDRVVMNENAKIIVEAGGKLIVNGDQGLYNTNVENLIIEAEEGNMGLFIWKPTVASNRHPYATVQLISKAHGSTIAQRFGIPAYNGIKIADIVKVGHSYGTVYKYWDNASDDWATIQTPQYILEPFRGYNMLIPSASSGNNRYALPCEELYGNVNAEMNFAADHGWNYFSNSYTGEINIKELLLQWRDLGKCEVAVQFNLSSTSNDWEGISLLDIDDLDQNIPGIYLPISKIAPMQCFITRTKENEEAFKDNLDYEALVWNHKDEANEPIGTPQASPAPARRNMAQVSDYTKAIVVIDNGENEQRVTLRQGSQFSEEFDNGAEMSCFKNGNINLFATTEYGDMAQVATDNLMGQTLSIESAKAASFKMTFTGLYGEQLAIRDNMTGSVINMTEGEEYFFSVAPGTTADRFEIVEAAKMPTDVEAIKAAPAKKGIYTLVGQYLGEDFEALPAGIYVVNGKKVVK